MPASPRPANDTQFTAPPSASASSRARATIDAVLYGLLPAVAAAVNSVPCGNGPGGGASKLTGDVTTIISQLPPIIESLTGVKFEKLMEQVPALRKAMGKDDDGKK